VSDLPTGTVTLLFTDIEGSTRLVQHLGMRYSEVLSECRSLLRTAFQLHHGHEVDTQGDAFFVAFARASDAIAAAVAAQRALFTNAWSEGVTMRVRMGLHSGEPQRSTEGYVGLDVHRAARIMNAGHGGQVLLSQTTRDLVEHTLPEGVHLVDLGTHRLKDLQRPSRLFQLAITGLPSDFPPLKTLDNSPNNLPLQPTPFIGREKEVAAVVALLRREEVRLVTLTGPGGTGKTRLGLQVAAELSTWFADGVFFVSLAPLSDPELVISAVAQALEMKEIGDQPLSELLQSFLREKHLLLVIDNFEHVARAAIRLADLLTTCAKIKVLVTSREALHLRAEQEYAVPALTLPDTKHLPNLVTLTQYEAVALFISRAQAVKPDFAVTNANAPAVAEICVRLDGLPLAIELAAARAKFFTPQALLMRLEQGFSVLSGGARDLPARQQTLRGAMAWSYDLLTPEEQALFRRLSVFVDGCTCEAAEVVCRAAGEPAGDILDGLLSLVDKSLLRQQESTEGEPRFWMLQLLREFGLEALAKAGESEGTHRAHAEYFLALAEQAEPELRGPDQAAWLAQLEDEHDNLRAALGWMREQHEWEWGLRLAAALQRFWETHGDYGEGRQWLETLLAKGPLEATAVRAKALGAAGHLAIWQGDYRQARFLLEESLSLFRKLGDKASIALALDGQGSLAFRQGDYRRARALLEESLMLQREMGNTGDIAWVLFQLGQLALANGDYGQARDLFEECLSQSRELDDKVGITWGLDGLGSLALSQGNLSQARTLLEECLSVSHELGNKDTSSFTLSALGKIALLQGEYSQARALFEECLMLQHEMGDKANIANTLSALGTLARLQGDYGQARALLEESLSLSHEMGNKAGIAWSLGEVGTIASRQGDYDQARTLLEESLSLCRELGDKAGIAWVLIEIGTLDRLQGDYKQARTLLEESLSLCRQLGDKVGSADCLDGLAQCASEQGNPRGAAGLFGAVESVRLTIGAPLPPVDRPAYERAIASVRTQLGEEAFLAVWSQGKTLTLDEAIAAWEQTPMPEPILVEPSISKPPAPPTYPNDLTEREVEVLRLIAHGWTNPQIAEHLVISPRTVNAHLTSIYRKIQVSTRSAATRFAIQHHLV
jgi:predicted ATPase/class 3 adenylate cyclase/DNA-binding CsgD family transcriptional regulator/uncharacterized protein HemY